jgi:modification methylase
VRKLSRRVVGDVEARRGQVRLGDVRHLTHVLGNLAGTVDLVATSPPYGGDVGMIDKPAWLAGRSLCRRDTLNYSTDHANLGHARGDRYLAELASVYAGCFALLRPGGLLVVVTKNLRRRGRLLDVAAATVQLAEQAGFGYLQHVLALRAAVRDSQLHARPSFWQLTQTRKARARGEPAHLVVHEDVLVFARRGLAAPTLPPRARQPGPQDGHPASERGAATPSHQRTPPRGGDRRGQG